MSLFRLLHVSDFHYCTEPNRKNWVDLFRDPPGLSLMQLNNGIRLSDLPTSYSAEISEASARFLLQEGREFDLVVISGDVATIGSPDSIAAAFRFVDESRAVPWSYLSSTWRPTLGGDARRTFLLPGNHDRFRDRVGSTGSPEFNRSFQKYWNPSLFVQHKVLQDGNSHLAVVAGDFCLATDGDVSTVLHRLGRGKAYAEIVGEMASRTSWLRSKYENVVPVWVTHFPPIQLPLLDTFLALIDGEHLRWEAKRQDVAVILAGHLHRTEVHLGLDMTPVLCAGSMCAIGKHDNNWIHGIEIECDGATLIELRKNDFGWKELAGDFVGKSFERIL